MSLVVDNINLNEDTPKFRNFDWEKSKTFYYVAKLGSFSSAARFLNISQPALSRQINYLEHHLECPLFTRHSGGIKLTRKGEQLFSIVGTTYQEIKWFTQNVHMTLFNGEKRKIRISATNADVACILNDLILDYKLQNPKLIFEIVANDHLLDIDLNDVDIAIRPFDPTATHVQQEPLFTLDKMLYASIEYLEKYGEPKTVEELKHHHIIAFGHPELPAHADVNWILKLGKPEGELHEPIHTSNSIECLLDAANKGMGIIASYEKITVLRKTDLKRILPSVTYKEKADYIVYPNYHKKDTEIMAIKKYLHEKLSGEG
jgi:DNA-binding transcriptional LysR family regulator